MSDKTFAVGDEVTILDVKKVGKVTEVSEDGATLTVSYTDDAGAAATETGPVEKFAAVDGGSDEKKDEE